MLSSADRSVSQPLSVDVFPYATAGLAVPPVVSPKYRDASFSRSVLDRLSPELQLLLLDHLREIDYRALLTLRLVCRRLDAIATPIAYRTLELTHKLVSRDAQARYPDALCNASKFTHHLIVKSYHDSEGVDLLISNMPMLKSIRWQYVGDNNSCVLPLDRLPCNNFNFAQLRQRCIKFYLDDIPLRVFSDIVSRNGLSTCLVSLRLGSPFYRLPTNISHLKQLLVRCKQLETLQLQDWGQGTSFSFACNERMPAMRDLALKSYDWNHGSDEVARHWDFSRLQSLRLTFVPILNFFNSVSMLDLSGLRRLQIDDYSPHLLNQRQEATRLLHTFVKHHARQLEVLDIKCCIKMFPLDAILRHKKSLRRLCLRDYTGFWEDNQICPTLSLADLTLLAGQLQSVRTLELDMDLSFYKNRALFRALNQFPFLQELTLHVQTSVRVYAKVQPRIDADFESAMKTFRALTQLREQNNPDFPLKRITINVGGWKRIMIRRLSAEWRGLNQRGIFAERCFVHERDSTILGGYITKEEVCFDGSSGKLGKSSRGVTTSI